jgi:ABC-2 type transport system permease protein
MKGILAIFRRELNGYFVSPIAYIVIGLFLLIAGWLFAGSLADIIPAAANAQAQAARSGGPPPSIDVPGYLIRGFVGTLAFMAMLLTPMLTMGVYAEERRRGTMEMLMTSPVTELQIVLGKYLASLTLYVVMLAPTLVYYLAIGFFSDPPLQWKIVWASYLGIFLLGAMLLALGSFISSLTENQIVAVVATFVLFILLWVINLGASSVSGNAGEILKYLSILQHYQDFSQGIIDTTNVIFYLSGIVLGLFLTLRSLDSMRWRRA